MTYSVCHAVVKPPTSHPHHLLPEHAVRVQEWPEFRADRNKQASFVPFLGLRDSLDLEVDCM